MIIGKKTQLLAHKLQPSVLKFRSINIDCDVSTVATGHHGPVYEYMYMIC